MNKFTSKIDAVGDELSAAKISLSDKAKLIKAIKQAKDNIEKNIKFDSKGSKRILRTLEQYKSDVINKLNSFIRDYERSSYIEDYIEDLQERH